MERIYHYCARSLRDKTGYNHTVSGTIVTSEDPFEPGFLKRVLRAICENKECPEKSMDVDKTIILSLSLLAEREV